MGKTFVSMRLTSDEKSPEQIFAALGVPADKSWRKGDRRENTILIEKENGYEFRSNEPGEMAIEEQTCALLCRLDPIAEKIRTLRCDHVQLTCVVYSLAVPSVHFSASLIEKISRLGASIDIDLYITEGNWVE